VHWAYASKFRSTFPDVPVQPEKALVATGDGPQMISSGASTSWHDLVLYLVSRHAGPAAAFAAAKFFALEWHRDGLAPYAMFVPPREHGDRAILACQDWLAENFSVGNPVEEMAQRSGLAVRTFKRRFAKATGMTPISYVQSLRIEETKRMLERTDSAIDDISWQVGYEDPAFFRRLFKRHTEITPGMYRRKFKLPGTLEE
jgi:transcriptional regulator GlxA family with amidase domain